MFTELRNLKTEYWVFVNEMIENPEITERHKRIWTTWK